MKNLDLTSLPAEDLKALLLENSDYCQMLTFTHKGTYNDPSLTRLVLELSWQEMSPEARRAVIDRLFGRCMEEHLRVSIAEALEQVLTD
jgi:NAD(P)H-hydrate repair Nnr-like enzyme with NAD(P)H-hydrate epimerase domain